MSLSLPSLPDGWSWATVADVGATSEQAVLTGPFGTSLGPDDFVAETASAVPVLTIGCLREAGIDLRKATFVTPAKATELERYRLRAGDILFSRMATVGRAGLVRATQEAALFNYHIMRLRLRDDAIDPLFFIYYVRSSEVVRAYVRSVNHGMTRDGINTEQLVSMPLPLAPRNQQRRIVEAIEDVLSRLDAAVANLEAAQRKLKAYRASVLNAAVEGRLVPTEADLARKEGRSYEPAEALLERILQERRRSWETAEMASMKAAGKTPKDDKWKTKYKEPTLPDVDRLPRLPEGWCWTTLDAVADVKGGITKGQKRRPGEALCEVPYLRVANVQRGYLDLRQVKTIEATPSEVNELRLVVGDVLFNEGGDRDKLGRGWVWNGEIRDCIHQNHVFRARLLGPLRPKFVSWYANSKGQSYFFDQGKQTTNLASVNMTKLKALRIPVPPLTEQDRILEELDRLLSVADATANYISAEVHRCRRLGQSILSAAFDGRLVAQDPASEPADVMLARIRAERSAAVPAIRKLRRARKLKAAS